MIVLDASVIIAYLDDEDALHSDALGLLEAAAEEDLAVSTITLAEVLVGPTRRGDGQRVLEALDDLAIRELTLPSAAAAALASLRVETGLKLPDCCVLLVALQAHAMVASFDHRLSREAARRGIA